MARSISIENLQIAFERNNSKLIEYITEQINKIETIKFEWVEELPTENISTNTIYLVKHVFESEKEEPKEDEEEILPNEPENNEEQQEENLEVELLNNELSNEEQNEPSINESTEELPEEIEPDVEVITSINNIYDEYIYNKITGWELINTVDIGNVNLENYYTITEIDNLLNNLLSNNIITYTDEEINNTIIESINILNEEGDNNDTSTD
jgi:hypothetical protein